MKLALLTAIREIDGYPIESFFKRIATNLAPMYLAGYLEQQGVSVEIRIKDRLEDFADFIPDIVGISSVTENIETAKALAKRAKKLWGSVTILGGVHITALPQYLPKEFDIGVVGEGEETLVYLLEVLRENRQASSSELQKIQGISFHDGVGVQFTGFRKGIDCLDSIPFPARERYVKNIGIAYMMTSRGCPYKCSFCTIPIISEGYRMHSPDYVVEEIKSLKTHYPMVEIIRIFDDLFIANRNRVEQIAERVDAEGLNQELAFSCWGRANLIDQKTVEVFKKMNMGYVAFGAESGSSRVLSQINPAVPFSKTRTA